MANTSSVSDDDFAATYDVDDRKSKNCEIEFKAKFNFSGGELKIGYAYDDDEYQTTGSYFLLCGQSLKFTYDAESDGYIVSKDPDNSEWISAVTRLKIPETFAGKPVTVISKSFFLADIEIPDSIIHIESGALYGRGFVSYNKYKEALYLGNARNPYVVFIRSLNKEARADIEINKATKVIYDEAFSGHNALRSIEIPDGVTSIGEGAFSGCFKLESVAMPDSVAYIGKNAFKNCNRLYSIKIPNVTSIGENAFEGCGKLRCNTYGYADYLGNEQNPYVILIKGSSTGEINQATKFIHSGAFKDFVNLESVTIPNNVKSIDSYTFSGCSRLKSVSIPDGVTNIGDYAFSNCISLTDITIPDNVTNIGENAFLGCDNLRCNEYGNAYYLGNEQNPYVLLVKPIRKSIKSVDINSSTRFIHSNAFWECESLKSVTIPDSVTSIGERAFWECSSLKSVTIPNSIKIIDGSVFSGCDSLKSIDIPNSVIAIKGGAFSGCSSLKSVTLPNTIKIIDGSVFSGCDSLKSIDIPDSVTSIEISAFSGAGLTSITIPDSVRNIGESAFEYCGSLTSITIPKSVISIGKNVFYGCKKLKSVVFDGTKNEWCKIAVKAGKADYYGTRDITIICSDGKLRFTLYDEQ